MDITSKLVKFGRILRAFCFKTRYNLRESDKTCELYARLTPEYEICLFEQLLTTRPGRQSTGSSETMTYFEALFLAPPRFVVASALTPVLSPSLSLSLSLSFSLSLSLPIVLLEKLLPGLKVRPRKELQHRHIQLLRSLTNFVWS